MCIPHGASGSKSNGFVKKERPAKHIERVSDDIFEHGDPDFVDERIKIKSEEKETFIDKLKNIIS